MLILKIILILLGLAFVTFGYFIYFRKKYSLINGFDADLKAGRKTELYAKRVGLVEIIVGIVLIVIGTVFLLL